MKANPFSDIKKKSKKVPDKEEFINSAKVDGESNGNLNKNERRGSSYIDKETGLRVKLSGKILQVPVNGYELQFLEEGAKKMGLPLGSYLRTLGIEAAKKLK
ncbi:hypothetical protein LRP52_48430 [Photobacterium sp. ZSDE20]|nr:hypothetical protein [Photobacterium sp. ZSDE20]